MKSGTRTVRGHEPYGTNCTARRMGGREGGVGHLHMLLVTSGPTPREERGTTAKSCAPRACEVRTGRADTGMAAGPAASGTLLASHSSTPTPLAVHTPRSTPTKPAERHPATLFARANTLGCRLASHH